MASDDPWGMGYQFIHLETYSRKADAAGRSTAFVLDEADRRPDACQHVTGPVAPTLVYGEPVADVRAIHDTRAAEARTEAAGKVRRIRLDQHTLATVVASFPLPWEEVRADPGQADALAGWEARTVRWLRDQYGDQLLSVLRHEDERFPHIHAYILPTDPSMRAKALHPGWAAKAAAVAVAKAGGADGKLANAMGDVAYKAAMRAWQDSYWQAVGLPCGLARLGPGKRRLTRAEWQTEQAAARNTATVMHQADRARRAVQDAEADFRARSEVAADREARAAAAAERAHAAIAEAKARLAEAKRAADAADARQRQAEADTRRNARAIIGLARAEGARIVAEAEAKVAPVRRLGGWLGSLWSGFRSVERRLAAAADERVAAARKAAAVEAADAKERLRGEVRQEVGDLLAGLRHSAERAHRERQAAEERLRNVEADAKRHADGARQVRAALAVEQSARKAAEADRERFRGMWADADNALTDLQRRSGLVPRP